MSKSEYIQVINASREKTWEVLFNQYGDIHVHNPTMTASSYVDNARKGELNCSRRCYFSEKLFLEEKITEVDQGNSFKIEAYEHNLPLLKDISANYELLPIGKERTQVKMTSFASTTPGFMIYLMKGTLGKGLSQHLFGLKYYVETGKTVSKDNYKKISKNYS